MKKNYVIFILAIACSFTVFSQIPNGSFENWTSSGTYENPVSWLSYNQLTDDDGIFTCEKGYPGYNGNYFLKLTSKLIPGLDVLQGYAFSGTMKQNGTIGGFSFSARPTNFTGVWQHRIYGTSQGQIYVQLTKWDQVSQSRILIASLDYTLTGMTTGWTNFSLPLTYFDSRIPDTCMIELICSGDAPVIDDFLYVDNLSFSGNGVSIDEASVNNMQVYPNPTKNQITIEYSNSTDNNGTITIVNLIGQTVYSEPLISNKQSINIEQLDNGIYFVTIKSNKGKTTQKVVVNR